MGYSPLSIQNAIMATRAVMTTPNTAKNVAGPFVKDGSYHKTQTAQDNLWV